MTMPLDGQVAIVTGAGRGLGRSYALALARAGAKVVVNDRDVRLGGESVEVTSSAVGVVAEIVAEGGEAMADHADVSSTDQVAAMIDAAVARWGRIDIVVCNAGIIRKLMFSETTIDDLRSHIEVHVIGSFVIAKAVWPYMVKQGYGRIVMTTSQVGMYGQLDAAAYGAAKMAVVGLMHGMKLEATNTGIRVNCVAPFAQTRMAGDTFPQSIAPFIDPACVAPAVVYLSSPQCTLHGEILIAGGGHFAMARTIETRGLDIDDPTEMTFEKVSGAMSTIIRRDHVCFYDDALGAVQATFDRLGRLTATLLG